MTKQEMIEDSLEKGSYWFSPDTLRWFGTVVETDPDAWGKFVTSEQDDLGCAWGGGRRYTVRQYDWDTGDVSDVSEFGEYATLKEAIRHI